MKVLWESPECKRTQRADSLAHSRTSERPILSPRQRGWLGMARIVAGFASSHTPLMSLPGQDWAKRAEDDKRNRELIRPQDGAHVTYDQLLASADPKIAEHIDQDVFVRKFGCIQQG